MRVHDARARVPELVLVHVETVGADAPHGADAGVGADPAKGAPAPNRSTQKASLERYRSGPGAGGGLCDGSTADCDSTGGPPTTPAPQSTLPDDLRQRS